MCESWSARWREESRALGVEMRARVWRLERAGLALSCACASWRVDEAERSRASAFGGVREGLCGR